MYYKGTVVLTDGVKALLAGNPNAGTTPYGDSCELRSLASWDPTIGKAFD